jgi:lambda family phage portal protein
MANLLDAIVRAVSPLRAAQRDRARLMSSGVARARSYYDGATTGRRAEAWRIRSTDANAEGASARKILREVARDLCRNNAYAARAKRVIAHNVVGTGIIPNVALAQKRAKSQVEDLFKAHLDTPSIDVLGRHDFYGIQSLVASTVVESGECLVRYRPRRAEDRLPLNFQLQVMEPDYLDTLKDGPLAGGNTCVQGIEFDAVGRIVAYWLFDQHPGSTRVQGRDSKRIPADQVAHIYWTDRAEEGRGISWFSPVIQRLRDLGDFSDAQLMRQKVAACFAAFITDDGTASDGLLAAESTTDESAPYRSESLEPGLISHLKPGEDVSFASPPAVGDYEVYTRAVLREVAAGLGISYEALTGDLSNVNFSSGRMGWLEFQRSIDAWRNHMLIPQLCQRVAQWALDAAFVEIGRTFSATVGWTAPRREMVSPAQEVPAIVSAIRAGLTSRSEEQRKLGFDPADLDAEIAADNARADELKITFDSDPRKTTQNGGAVQVAQPAPAPADPGPTQAMTEMLAATVRAVAETRAAPQSAPPINLTMAMPERVQFEAVKAVPRQRMTVQSKDEAGRFKTLLIEPVGGEGPRFLRTVLHDADGRAIGHEDQLIEEPTNV